MSVATIPLVVAVIGLLMWILASNAKVSEAGKILFFCRVLTLLLSVPGKSFHL
jgi:hypothetical protein